MDLFSFGLGAVAGLIFTVVAVFGLAFWEYKSFAKGRAPR